MGIAVAEAFSSVLAQRRKLSASKHKQALNAVLLLNGKRLATPP
jgi:hypothetical protein